jgi:hypothetical protein
MTGASIGWLGTEGLACTGDDAPLVEDGRNLQDGMVVKQLVDFLDDRRR